jgi:perosamine synthetase
VCQLARLDDLLARRRKVAMRYLAVLANHRFLAPPHVPEHVTPNWQSFQVRVRLNSPLGRNALMERLYAEGISTRRGVMASHLEPPYRDLGYHLPATESAAAECLQLPMHAGMSEADADAVLAAIAKAYGLA